MRLGFIFNYACKTAQYLWRGKSAMHGGWQTQWERVVTPPRRAPCEWMEVWLICSASESRWLAVLQSSARLFISFFHCRHTLYTHVWLKCAHNTTWFSQYQKQTQNAEAPHDSHGTNYANARKAEQKTFNIHFDFRAAFKVPWAVPKGVCRRKTRRHVLKKIFRQESKLFQQICHRLPKMVCRFVS